MKRTLLPTHAFYNKALLLINLITLSVVNIYAQGPITPLPQNQQKWNTNGNSVTSTDFIGTTNATSLIFRTTPGFSVQPGASFTAITTNTCADEYVRSNSHIRDRTVFSSKNNLTESNILYTISPNPSCEGIFKFTSNIEYNQIENVEIYNAVGKRIQNNKEIFDAFTINLNDYSKGMYFVKVKLINNPTIFVSKLIYI